MEKTNCKYCGSELSKVQMPFDSDWGVEYLMVCLNDDCGYYSRGWDWMMNNYKVKSSYRYFCNTFTDYEGPLPVARPSDYKNEVIV